MLYFALEQHFGSIVELLALDNLDCHAMRRPSRRRQPYLAKCTLTQHVSLQPVVTEVPYDGTPRGAFHGWWWHRRELI